MAQSRLKRRPRTGRFSHAEGDKSCPATSAPVSLPLPAAGLEPSPPLRSSPDKDNLPTWARKPDDSTSRALAIKIVALEAAGLPRDEIAKTLGIAKVSIAGILYKAGLNGWLDFENPNDQLEYKILHKVVRNLNEALDSEAVLQTGMKEKTAVTLKVAEGTMFKRYNEAGTNAASPTTLMGIKIEIVGGERTTVRDGTVVEAPAYTDGEVK